MTQQLFRIIWAGSATVLIINGFDCGSALCQRMGVMENTVKDGVSGETSRSVAVVPIRTAQPNKKAIIEMQLGDLQIKFNESPTAEQLRLF